MDKVFIGLILGHRNPGNVSIAFKIVCEKCYAETLNNQKATEAF
jgi:hypothetical protein